MVEPKSFHMTPAEFRAHGRAVVDFIADYLENVGTYPVLARVEPGAIRAGLPAHPPEIGEPFAAILGDVATKILPGITHWQSPNFFAYFPANSSGPSILGDLLASGLAVQGMLWATSPACTELETHVLDWLVEMLGLPEAYRGGGVIQDSGSSANLCALLAARERASGGRTNQHGGDGRLVAYASPQTHSSIEKAVKIAGLGRERLHIVPADAAHALRPDALAARIAADRAAGLVPAFVCATVGTTSAHAMDPLRALGEICRREKVWLHVDAAMAGSAAICPQFRHLQDGVELADSYCFDPHKWLFTNFDCSVLYVAEKRALIDALSILPEYLKNASTASGAVIDYRDWHVPLGRRFRALKLWFVIRHYGVEGLRHHIARHVELAQGFARAVAAHPDFELAAPAPLNLVCFRHRGGDVQNRALLAALNDGGRVYLTHTVLDGKFTLRMSIAQTTTEAAHVDAAWRLIQETSSRLP